MSARSDLEKRARELAAELNVENPARGGIKNEELAQVVEELETQMAEVRAKAEREALIRAEAEARELTNVNENRNPYDGSPLRFKDQVAPGKQLKCRFGTLQSGAQVKPEYVGGQERLDALWKAGAVIRSPD